MLLSNVPYITRCVSVVSHVVGIDVEVVDSDLCRIAGTGDYAAYVGQSIDSAGQIYKEVLKTGRSVVLTDPQKNPICQGCPGADHCREKLTICSPIIDDGRAIGVLGMVCFTDDDRKRVLEKLDNYSYFVEQIAALISSRLYDERILRQEREFGEAMIRVLDTNDRGVIVFNNMGKVFHINSRAKTELELKADQPVGALTVQSTGQKFSEFDELAITVGGQRFLAVGNRHLLGTMNTDFASVLVFNTMNRFKDHVSSFVSENPGSGLSAIIGASEGIVRLKGQIKQVATSTSTVLITGESGTGKELVARAIHMESARKDKAFIAINCGAIPETLLESELFGYAKGAFSGANPKGRIGKFELANHGVLFLDEIGTLPLYLQVKLLRVLQERQVVRLGANNLIDIDVRIIAATNQDLTQSIDQNMFREDLYYRLNVIPIELPPLRERRNDLEALANYFLDKYSRLFNKEIGAVSPPVLAVLAEYDWPGNIRELENAIEYAVNMMPQSGYLSPEYLPPKIIKSIRQGKTPKLEEAAGSGFVESLGELEKRAIQRALTIYGHDSKAKTKAAKALGIGVATLYRKIKEHHL